jgi:hypothetical protein
LSPLLRFAGLGAASLWFLFCLRYFGGALALRPGWLDGMPAFLLGIPAFILSCLWLARHRAALCGPPLGPARAGLLLAAGLALLFRLPLAWWGAWGYTTADGALSGTMALDIRSGTVHHVFIPSEPYSGSLKSYLTAGLASLGGISPVRALTLVSVLFYVAFVAAAFRLGLAAAGARPAFYAALYAAFPPTFVNWYSLSNDGNYVEVLALGSWALWLTLRLLDAETPQRPALGVGVGLLLGLALWCHILGVAYLATVAVALLLALRARALPTLAYVAVGFVLGDLPGLLWNAAQDWESFRYLLPSGEWESLRPVEAAADGRPGLLQRVGLTLTDHAPVLFGYDAGYPPALDRISKALAGAGTLAFAAALIAAARRIREARRLEANALLLIFTAANLAAALLALPYIPGNPRYLVFLFGPACVLVAAVLAPGRRRFLLFALVAFGALGSLGQAQAKLADASAWRRFVADLRREGVRHCYTDYYLAARISFFAEEAPLCSSKLGPTTREYFLEHRERVERAPTADIVAVNATSAARMERKLAELGVTYERRDFMKPVLLRLSRKVDPRELFPGRDFRPR